MKKVLVIGYGNTLRGDDAAGVRAAELIAERHPEIESLCLHQLMPELAEQIAECDTVVFLDADVNATQPNARLLTTSDSADQPRTHFLSPKSLLTLSQQLYRRVPAQSYSIGIPASSFGFSEHLSSRSASAVQECLAMVKNYLTR